MCFIVPAAGARTQIADMVIGMATQDWLSGNRTWEDAIVGSGGTGSVLQTYESDADGMGDPVRMLYHAARNPVLNSSRRHILLMSGAYARYT